jgi:hypothetical protein
MPPGAVTRGALVSALVVVLAACTSAAQSTPSTQSVQPAPHAAPQAGYQLHDTRMVGGLTVERWVATASPEVAPSGMCECITIVYLGERKVLTFGEPNAMTAATVEPISGTDITGDSQPEIVVSTWSGGAHCCYATAVYSIGSEVRTVLNIETGNCGPGEFMDLDGDRRLEIVTCDDRWGYVYCTFAESPLPRVVLAYDAVRAGYEVATPRYAASARDEIAAQTRDARTHMAADGGKDAGADKCAVLRPALGLMYAGEFDEGRQLIRDLYRGADLDAFEREVVEGVRASRLWVAR